MAATLWVLPDNAEAVRCYERCGWRAGGSEDHGLWRTPDPLNDRAIGERLRRRSHLVRLRTSATNRTFGLLTQSGLRRNLTALRKPGALQELAEHGVPDAPGGRRPVTREFAAAEAVLDGLSRGSRSRLLVKTSAVRSACTVST